MHSATKRQEMLTPWNSQDYWLPTLAAGHITLEHKQALIPSQDSQPPSLVSGGGPRDKEPLWAAPRGDHHHVGRQHQPSLYALGGRPAEVTRLYRW